ncbi:MAG: hypothetical protein EWV55_19365 [Microcystis viridis Mv_BB_P_19951000_S69]|uniref:Uncharacterized protein n=1 Tax=Microcystis viridis Mv_BB_P_19951000_S68D TaxID=2486270 RepID=A0A552H5C1_MICVR|nr:MAG: hypothetical protein EWV77_24515 [Microcystis viridis Mv_BB_P_19951000_S68D]TRU70393.1 MAG: hypothetical protein EWV55_19365 [Microcystis viridis Mv_BB_P_19951000_S69]TRU71506.1 MAG: hypothetical protein EWV47_16710 [Microcystis viridis Mv_BB_P_19951000_S68]TRU84372.1 MAG: hypothetical protein EWV46_14650 [Microcystis viridis Mv_BB_P_19951000_S69D]
MPETTTTEPTKIEFIQYHRPALKDGDYQITLTQQITGEKIPANTSFQITRKFSVGAERFDLKPTAIHAVFPPDGSLGEHSKVLPHIILNRSTLPWERQAVTGNNDNNNITWLALLLFEETEAPETKIITLETLKDINSYPAKFPNFTLESGQHEDDKVIIIDVQKQLLEKILPTKEDLTYLAHVRQGTDEQDKLIGDELAVIICNRLPQKGGRSIVHLVSLEGRYHDNGFDFQGAGDNDNIRLVSLKSWSFSCIDEKQSFQGLLNHLNRQPSTLRLPKADNSEAEKYLSMGYVPLPHFLRQGGKTFSWYHSPLITGNNPNNNITLPIRTADELLIYNPDNGIFDVSYSAAWELGRLLALQSKNLSISLYNWKRTHRQSLQKTETHLPVYNQLNTDLPESISSWFKDLSLLKGVPFNYLVPDEKMLPVESIRFFYIDSDWIECLLDGAFGIGRVTTSDYKNDQDNKKNPAVNTYPIVTGCLLRSDVVSGWPSLLVDGYNEIISNDAAVDDSKKIELLRMERLSANVLICLFNGEIKTLDIHQKPETLHFGLDSDDENKTFYKKLKNLDGQQIDEKVDNIPWKDSKKRVIAINSLTDRIKEQVDNSRSFTSAQFALEMIEGVEKVRFIGS